MPSADRFFSGRGSAAPGILRLVRASIALSPLADVTAGGCLAAAAGAAALGAATAPALACSLFLFLFGMAQNDLADRDRDALLRPERPIPSGAVSLRGARAVVLATGLAALSCGLLLPPAGRWLALLLFAAINGYNLAPRHLGAVGPLVLGLIRAGNLLLGAAALGPLRPLLPAAGCYLAYVAALSCAARLEDRAAPAPAGRLRVAVRAALLAALAAPAAAALALGCLAGLPA
ncbi:MAG: UbiA family prenyltransferase, partial [Planctomycetes bacterium]|nr:UbiA family prenyltransferase [Planctomycetota bacterium]